MAVCPVAECAFFPEKLNVSDYDDAHWVLVMRFPVISSVLHDMTSFTARRLHNGILSFTCDWWLSFMIFLNCCDFHWYIVSVFYIPQYG